MNTSEPLYRTLRAIALSLAFGLVGCGTNGTLLKAQSQYRSGSFQSALSTIRREAKKQSDNAGSAPVIRLEHGAMALTAGEKAEATEALRAADQALTVRDQKAVVQVGREAGALLTNLNSMAYNTSPSERVMGASLLALSFAANGELEKARSAIKLAKNRQADNFGKFQAQIERERQSLQQAVEANPQVRVQLKPGAVDGAMRTLDTAADRFQPYTNFSVPYSELIAGILLGAGPQPDPGRSRESFGHVLACYPKNEHVRRAAAGSQSGMTHVIIEEGVAPSLGQFRMDVPIVLNGKVVLFSAAFPSLEIHPQPGESVLRVGKESVATGTVCEFDRIVASEYRRKLPGTVARTVAASTLKAVISYAAQEAAQQQDPNVARLAAVATGIYNVASAQADRRIVATLPKTVRYACIKTPESGHVYVNGTKVDLARDGKTQLVVARVVNGSVSAFSVGL
jgi:hypothetical protein